MTPALVAVRDVSRSFALSGTAVHAVRNVTLDVAEGEFVALRGRSGSGKTTLLNLIAGLDRPDSGTVHLGGEEVSSASEARLTELRRHSIGFVFQSFALLPLFSARENVGIALRIAGVHGRAVFERADEVIDLVGLGPRKDHRPYELSGGEQQRVAIARAIANRPPLLIADEPTGELDSATGAQIFELLQRISAEGTTVIAATHDPLMIEHVERIVEMEDGALVGQSEVGQSEEAPEDWSRQR
ncbi:MAG: ABC transporter ATP-binding protein [Chloroflexota bacterium]|nr:ABC transporter ATP-binding protein [Chloroflexota bacterium]